MALFKILQGLDTTLNSTTNPLKLTEGYCYFTIDNHMFYVDHNNKEGTLVRSPLNAQNANTITEPEGGRPASVTHTMDSEYIHIPSCLAVSSYLEETILPPIQVALDLKMDKANPTGTGYFNLNGLASATPGNYSFIAGYEGTATGDYSFASGYQGKATGSNSIAMGNNALASGITSVAIGDNVLAKSDNQTVFGRFNVEDTGNQYSLIIGGGFGDAARKNLFTIDWGGNAVFTGKVSIGNPTIAEHAATKGYVDSQLDTLIQLTIIEAV